MSMTDTNLADVQDDDRELIVEQSLGEGLALYTARIPETKLVVQGTAPRGLCHRMRVTNKRIVLDDGRGGFLHHLEVQDLSEEREFHVIGTTTDWDKR